MKEVRIEEFVVSGVRARTNNVLEFSAAGKISGLWEQLYAAHSGLESVAYGA